MTWAWRCRFARSGRISKVTDQDRYEDIFEKLSHGDAAQARMCARTLVRRPLIYAGGPEGELLPAIYGHREVLRRLFTICLGYPLRAERRFARLYKTLDSEAGRGVPGFTPRSYVYLALALAALVEAGRQILLSQLVADIRGAAAEARIAAGDDLVELRTLTAALKHLVGLGVLEETEGTVADLGHGGSGEALITVDTELLGLMMARTNAAVESVLAGPRVHEPAVIGLPPGMNARRRLVEDPVVLYADLSAAEAEYLRRYQRREGYWLDRYFGLQIEARAEGVAVIDPEEYLTDLLFPAGSTVARMALLTLEPLLAQSAPRDADGCYPVSLGQIRNACADLAERYPSAWAKGDLANLDGLASKVADMLFQTGTARRISGEAAVLVPAACRWKPRIEERKAVAESVHGSADDELTLFGDEDARS